jgi:hypothetical protein
MPLHPKILAACALACTACASTPSGQLLAMRPPELGSGTPADFSRQGEIQFTPFGTAGSSAAWDARSVRGPAVNLTLTDGGLWGGTIQDRVVLLHARNGRITGEGVDIWVTRNGPAVRVQGLWFGRMVGVDWTPTTVSASPLTGVCAIELALAPDGLWRGFGGCGGRLDYTWMSLKGVAADLPAEMPQWLFAFLGALPAPQVSTFRPGSAVAVVGGGVAGLGYFLPAEFRGPAPWNAPPMPCSIYDQRLCGPWGFDPIAYRSIVWSRGYAAGAVAASRASGGGTGSARTAEGGSGSGRRNGGTGVGGGGTAARPPPAPGMRRLDPTQGAPPTAPDRPSAAPPGGARSRETAGASG